MTGAILLVLAALVGGGAFAVSRLLEPEDLRDQLVRQAEETIGGMLAVQGGVDLDLLPWPTMTMARANVTDGPAARGGVRLEVDRLEFQLEPLSLLRGEVEVAAVKLVRPILQLPRPPEGLPALLTTGQGLEELLPLERPALSRFGVVDGTAVVQGTAGADYRLEAVNLDIELESERGPFTGTGGFVSNGHILQMEAQIGRVSENSATTLQLELDVGAPSDPLTMAFRGLASRSGRQHLRGQISLAGDDVVAGVEALAAALGGKAPGLPEWLAGPYEISGALVAEDDRVQVDDLRADLDGTTTQGRLELTGWPAPRLNLDLALPRLDLPDPLPRVEASFAPLAELPTWLEGEIELSFGQIAYRGDFVRRARLTLALAEDGRIAFREARAVLPGNTDLQFTGHVGGAGGKPEIQGLLTVVTERLRTLLQWLDVDPPDVPPDRLQSFSLTGALELSRERFRLIDAEIRVDASQVLGSLALEQGAKPRLAATIEMDRLDLDSYWPTATPGATLALARTWIEQVDLALEAEFERLIWRQQRWSEVTLNGRSIDGRLILERLETGGLANATAELAGEIDFAAERFDLTGSMSAPQPALLLTRLGFAPRIALARLAPFRVDGRAVGWRDDFDLNLEVELEEIEGTLAGSIAWEEGQPPAVQLEVEASRPDYAALIEGLAIAGPGGAQVGQGPLQLTGQLRGRLDQEMTLAGTATLGATRLTGQIARHDARPRPRWQVRLSLNDPTLETLLPPLVFAGLRLDPAVLARPIVGNWPKQPATLDWVGRIDAQVEVSGKGGFAGDGLEMLAKLRNGQLTLERLASDMFGGELEAEASLHLNRPTPLFGLALDLRSVDPAALAAWLNVPPVLEGRLDLHGEATAIGRSPFELVRSLFGYATVDLSDGHLLGLGSDDAAAAPAPQDGVDWPNTVDLAKLAGRFEIRRGIARSEGVTLDLDQAEGEVDGVIDLLLWVVDLELALKSGSGGRPPLTLEIVGPLDAPQVVRPQVPPRAEGAGAAPQTPDGTP